MIRSVKVVCPSAFAFNQAQGGNQPIEDNSDSAVVATQAAAVPGVPNTGLQKSTGQASATKKHIVLLAATLGVALTLVLCGTLVWRRVYARR